MTRNAPLLFEIGTEEIPAGFLARALIDLAALAKDRLGAARLAHGALRTLGTPRRLALFVAELDERQGDVSELVVGPPAKAAFDAAGAPTKAAIGFAQKNNVAPSDLAVVEVPGKGAYVAARREERGADARMILPRLLREVMSQLPWKKSMRWGERDEAFVRPVHWVVALYDGEVVPVSLLGQESGRTSYGHRFLAPGPIELTGTLEDYTARLREAFVLVDPEARRTAIIAELARHETEAGVTIRPDEELLAEVTNLVEYPKAVCGTFDEKFLEVPEEVIVSAMRGHQRYFAAQAPDGALARRFVTIAGTITRDLGVVRHGNERVLAARLADARFFWNEDRRIPLAEHAVKLAAVVFQAKLGTIGDKVERVRRSGMAELVGVAATAFDRAALLAKADLTTKMVSEFPDLQGVMGRHYARLAGEPNDVADAILEHYLPRGAQDRLPAADLGAALGVADRMDTVVGCFAAGLAPTGSADAFGLRRAALAVLNIIIDRGWRVPLSRLVDNAARELVGKVAVSPELVREIRDFLAGRLRGLLVEVRKLPADCVDAALAAGADDVPDAVARAQALAHLRARPDFAPLGVAIKRVANILKGEPAPGEPQPAAFTHPSETALWAHFRSVADLVAARIAEKDYDAALRELATLRPSVDKFFDDVLVMDKDPDVRRNRLALLGTINATFLRVGDFRQLAVQT